jgi:hypothetical protein
MVKSHNIQIVALSTIKRFNSGAKFAFVPAVASTIFKISPLPDSVPVSTAFLGTTINYNQSVLRVADLVNLAFNIEST